MGYLLPNERIVAQGTRHMVDRKRLLYSIYDLDVSILRGILELWLLAALEIVSVSAQVYLDCCCASFVASVDIDITCAWE
jgi:hypothetical protein